MPLRFIFSLSILFFVLAACKKDEDPPVEPATSANIVGKVTLYDEGTTQLESSGMIVSVDGQSITTTTDDNGAFTLENVSFGDRTLIFEKDGYGIFKHVVEHETDGTPTFITQNFPLGQSSSTEITSISAEESGGNIVVSVEMDPPASLANTRYLRFFYGSSPDLNDINYEQHTLGLVAQILPYELTLTGEDLDELGYSSGSTVYVRCYGDSFWSNEFVEADINKTVFPNLNATSPVAVSFVVP